jgi:glyceraldehyde-3-phosphate dehydrogenase (ferredoxin)
MEILWVVFLSWLMDCLDSGLLTPEEIGVSGKPKFYTENFDLVNDSMRNADLGIEMLNEIVKENLQKNLILGARKIARAWAKCKSHDILDKYCLHCICPPRMDGAKSVIWTPGCSLQWELYGQIL